MMATPETSAHRTESRQLVRHAGLVGFLTLLSRLAGLARDMAIAYAFGTRAAADAFFVAFRIPNLLRRLLAEGALSISFVPVFTETLRHRPEEARRVVSLTFTLLLAVLLVITGAGMLAARPLTELLAWGFRSDPAKLELTAQLTRLMFPFILLVSLAALGMGVLNSVKKFAAPAAASIFLNFGIIAGALFLTRLTHPPVMGLAWGVLIGGVLQLAIHIPGMKAAGLLPKFEWQPGNPAVRKILKLMLPAAYGAAVYQFNVIVVTFLASFLPSGGVSYLWYADRIVEFPIGIFVMSLATVSLPTLSHHAAGQDLERLKSSFDYGLRLVFALTLPATVGLVLLADPIVALLFQRGQFTAVDAYQTSLCLTFFALGMPFVSAVRMTANAFYALQEPRAPVVCANVAVFVNAGLGIFLMQHMHHAGLALALSASALVNFLLQMRFLSRRLHGLPGFWRGALLRQVLATSVMGLGLWGLRPWLTQLAGDGTWGRVLDVFAGIGVGLVLFLLAAWVLRVNEVRELLRIVGRKLQKCPQKP